MGFLTIEKRNELVSGALSTKGEGNGGESVNGVQAQEDIVVLQAWSVLIVWAPARSRAAVGGNLLT